MRVVRADLAPVGGGEVHVDEAVLLRAGEARGRGRGERLDLAGGAAQRGARHQRVALREHGPQELDGARLVVPVAHVAGHVAHQVDVAALPRRPLEPLGDGALEPAVGVGDHELDPVEPAVPEVGEEAVPVRVALGVHDVRAAEVLAAVLAQRDGGDDRLRDAPALHAALDPCGVEPQAAPALPAERPGPELVDLGVERGAHGRHARAGHGVEPQLARHGLDLPGRHALHVHLGDRGGQSGVGAAPAPQDVVGEVGALPGLGDLEREIPGGGGQSALAVAVPRVHALLGALPPRGAARLVGLHGHERVEHGLGHLGGRLPQVPAALEHLEEHVLEHGVA